MGSMNGPLQLTVIRRVRFRVDLNPVKAYWNFGLPAPDWVVTLTYSNFQSFRYS